MATTTAGPRIRTKLLAMVMLLVGISIVVGAVSYYSLSKTLEQYQSHLLPDLETAHNIDALTAKAKERGIPYQRLVREAIEKAV